MKIICFGHTIDPAFIEDRLKNQLLVLLPASSSRLLNVYKEFKVLKFKTSFRFTVEDCSDFELLSKPEIAKVVKSVKATHFLVSHRSTKELFYRCKQLELIPIGNNFSISSKLENKLYFDKLLQKLAISKPITLSIHPLKLTERNIPYVIQQPDSFGSFGTVVVTNLKEHVAAVRSVTKKSTPYLIRKYVDGSVYGISMVVHKQGIILSALRQQCYFDKVSPKMPMTFAGIQWRKKSEFKFSTILQIEKACEKIGVFLNQKRFIGTVHFDLMINESGKVFFLECNPRPSSATPQLILNKDLIHKIGFSKILLGDYSNLPNIPRVPNSKFQGALLDLMNIGNSKSLKIPSKQSIDKKSIRYFFSLNRLSSSSRYSFVGTILSDDILFSTIGKLNARAKRLYKAYTGFPL